jgi:hypothetical protein
VNRPALFGGGGNGRASATPTLQMLIEPAFEFIPCLCINGRPGVDATNEE